MTYPTIIQGGMGAGVSNWRLAQSVARQGQLGVVSGTALDCILVRMLQVGDPGGHYRRALEHFPHPSVAERVLAKYYIAGGKSADEAFRRLPMHTYPLRAEQSEMIVMANFAEVFLAREGHDGVVGINLLEKIQLPNLPSMYGAMLAGVDYVLMGAGIPWQMPGALDRFVNHEAATVNVAVEDAKAGEENNMTFDPKAVFPDAAGALKRPRFLPIISSAVLGQHLLKKSTGAIDGFVVEGPTAGGHNAPPRGPMKLNDEGEPIYGPRDAVDWEAMRKLGMPFWVAGSCGSPEKLRQALELGAQGVQVGTLFAFCDESGLSSDVKDEVLQIYREAKKVRVFTDPLASPTGFPFKVISLQGTLSERDMYEERPRICDLGYLRRPYRRDDGTIGYRCPSEPVEDYVRKAGSAEDTVNRKCLCNGLMANIDLGQVQASGYEELPLLTAGSDFPQFEEFLGDRIERYTSRRVINYLLGREPAGASAAAEESPARSSDSAAP